MPKIQQSTAPSQLPEMIRLTTLANQLPQAKLQVLCEVAASLAADEVANLNGALPREAPTSVLTVKEILREVTGGGGARG